jgi:uncharacterized protein
MARIVCDPSIHWPDTALIPAARSACTAMKPRLHDPLALDVPALCREAAAVEGSFGQGELPRLAQSLWAGDDAPAELPPVLWSARGELRTRRGAEPQCLLTLRATVDARLRCERCLAPMTQPLGVERRYAFVEGEDEAAEADADNDEEDVLALTRRLDLRALVEDELILALPLVPRHELCPKPLPMPVVAEAPEPAPSPFAALAALRSVKSGR